MHKLETTERYRKPQSDTAAWRKRVFRIERDKVRKSYPAAKNIKHRVITHGQPDVHGDLAKTNSWAIRTEFEVEQL